LAATIPTVRARVEARLGQIEFPDLNAFGEDPFGFEPAILPKLATPFVTAYQDYFRVTNHGIENLPEPPYILVGNHSGQIPIDAMMVGMAALLESPHPVVVRAMVDHFVSRLPFIGSFFERCGQVTGTPENCRYLLAQGYPVLVFPEGTRGISKPYQKAYQLQSFGQGFLRLALAAKVPIVPVAIIGAEEMLPSLGSIKILEKMLGFPVPAILSPLPLPARFHLHWGEPMRFDAHPDDRDEKVAPMVESVRQAIADLIANGLDQRGSVF
jgi:1-acyl-sn-glycerol-3-phosphate acyltransferase